jgi:hypothetical protein
VVTEMALPRLGRAISALSAIAPALRTCLRTLPQTETGLWD